MTADSRPDPAPSTAEVLAEVLRREAGFDHRGDPIMYGRPEVAAEAQVAALAEAGLTLVPADSADLAAQIVEASRHGKVVIDDGQVVGVLETVACRMVDGSLYVLRENEAPLPADFVQYIVRSLPDAKEERA